MMQNNRVMHNCPENETNTALREHQNACLCLLQEFDRICKALNIPYILFAGTLLGAVRHKGFIPWDDDLDLLMLRRDYERFLAEADTILDHDRFYLQKEFSDHWPMFFSKLRMNRTTCLESYHPKDDETHQGVYIDIFPADDAARTRLGRRLQFYASKVVIAKSLDRRGYETHSKVKRIFMGICRALPLAPFLRCVRRENAHSGYIHTFFSAASVYAKNVYPRQYFVHTEQLSFEDGNYPVPREYDKLLRILYGDYMQIPPHEKRAIKQHAVLVDLHSSYEQYRDIHREMVFQQITRSIR